MRYLTQFSLAVLLTAVFTGAVPSGSIVHARASVNAVGIGMTGLGKILVNARGLTVYYWEKERPGTIKCTGACASAWPPVLARKGARIPRTMEGVKGTFGVIKRPEGTLQITFNKRALYLYEGDRKPGDTLCQASDGWYVIASTGRLTGPSGS